MAGRLPVALVVAVAENGVIGRDNGLIWRLKTDLRHFRALTLGRPVVMGRKTFDSIGKPLPGRETIVLTRDAGFAAPGVTVARSLDEALALGQKIGERLGADSVTVAGGAQVYAQAMPFADRLNVTLVHASPEGDALFPKVDPAVFSVVRREDHPAGPDDEHAFSFVDYERRRAA
ncbi:dihydrofolate reductase [Alsobacter sp. SYSU M60028]|uniref:Dihydrofolate reductase n=1 Tax=Alsobacter ponti TaxID=2962936 RepID=A0ABT1L6Z8_9HYPH|nr:dihydrofolate reductase [Alsobacter ponti]MCP8937204.1 dihydrofolate reductase [Alsobacter ponti]